MTTAQDNRPTFTPSALYVAMRDGVRLAVDVWRAADDRRPTLLLTTRYWRSFALREDRAELQGVFALASYFTANGFVVVNVDSRGSGASFGTRPAEWSDDEVADMGDIIDWIVAQPWSDGAVVAHGFSYGGNTAFLAAVSGRPALKGIAPQFADFDIYRHNLFPGGVPNRWLRDSWGQMTAALDKGDVAALSRCLPAIDDAEFRRLVVGPRPVDADVDGSLLRHAVAEHAANFNLKTATGQGGCLDDPGLDSHRLSIYGRQEAIERSGVPIVYWAGWFDAGTADGALSLFTSFSNPMRVIIGPWSHGRRYAQDPFSPEVTPAAIPLEENYADVCRSMGACIAGNGPGIGEQRLDYYTLGENRWKTTAVWPLPNTRPTRLYLADHHRLIPEAPQDMAGSDIHHVDEDATTGGFNRWHTQIGCIPVVHDDRRQADERLLVYDGAPLERDVEITGHPMLYLSIRSDQPDGDFFAYLEMISPDGIVRLITEGCLRASHRHMASSDQPYRQFGPAHSYLKRDRKPLAPGESALIAFPLLPISIRVPAGYCLRLAIAGADKDTFEPMRRCAAATVEIDRNRIHPSFMELPVIS